MSVGAVGAVGRVGWQSAGVHAARLTPPARLAVMVAGQSLAEYPFLRGTPRVALDWGAGLRTAFGYAETRPFVSYSTGTLVHDGSNSNATDWSVRLLNSASGGSALMSETNSTETAAGNYWWNTTDGTSSTGNPLDVADSPGPLLRAAVTRAQAELAAGVTINAIIWSQGTTEATYIGSNVERRALYKATMVKVFHALRAVHPRAMVLIHRIGRHQTSGSAGYEAIRNVQTELIAEFPWIHFGADEYAERFGNAGTINNANTTSGSATITMASTSGLSVNIGVAGAGIPEGAYIVSLIANTSITLNTAATATASGVTLYRVDSVHLYPGTDSSQPLDTAGGTTHNGVDGFYAVAARSARRTARVFNVPGFEAGTEGPRLSSVIAAAAGGTTIDIAVQHDGGTDITVVDATGWRVEVDGSARTISSVARVNATTIRITLSSGLPSGALSVWYAYGAMNRVVYTSFIRDNAAVSMPLQPTCPALTAVL